MNVRTETTKLLARLVAGASDVQLDRAGERQYPGPGTLDRLGGPQSQDWADPLAPGEQRVAHRLVETLGGGLVGERQRLEVALYLGTEMLWIGGRGERAAH